MKEKASLVPGLLLCNWWEPVPWRGLKKLMSLSDLLVLTAVLLWPSWWACLQSPLWSINKLSLQNFRPATALAAKLWRFPWTFMAYYWPDAVWDGTREEMCISVLQGVLRWKKEQFYPLPLLFFIFFSLTGDSQHGWRNCLVSSSTESKTLVEWNAHLPMMLKVM